MLKFWVRQIGLPLVVALALFAVAAATENQIAALLGVIALAFAAGGGRSYRIYRDTRIRAQARQDARDAARD